MRFEPPGVPVCVGSNSRRGEISPLFLSAGRARDSKMSPRPEDNKLIVLPSTSVSSEKGINRRAKKALPELWHLRHAWLPTDEGATKARSAGTEPEPWRPEGRQWWWIKFASTAAGCP